MYFVEDLLEEREGWSQVLAELFFFNMERFRNLRVILVQGHDNLLCVVPVLAYVLPKQALG